MAVELKLYEYAVVKQPLFDKNGKQKEKGEVIVPITSVLAADDGQANLIAGRAIPEDQMGDLERLTLVVRPF